MREIVSKRRTHSKVFDLGGRKRKVRVSRAPLHYERDGKLLDIDTTLRTSGRLLETSEAPYRLKLDPERPAYLYTTETGRQVEVELIEVGGQLVNARGSAQEAGTVRWRGVAPQTDAAFRPLRNGIEALVVFYGPEAPRVWKWRVRGDRELLMPPKGRDAQRQSVELQHSYDGEVLTIVWTGRANSQERLRRGEGWTDEVAYPVAIDPTINESIIAGADDASSFWSGGNPQFFSASRSYAEVGAYGQFSIYGGVRFQDIGIPQGATITEATLTIDILGISASGDANVYGDDVDDAPAWSTGSRIANIAQTSASTNFPFTTTGALPIAITGIVQELVHREGWASGNNMRFGLFKGSEGHFAFHTFEGSGTEAQLDIEYEEAGGAAVAPKMMHYRRLRI